MGQLYLDGVPSWTAGGPINFGDYLPTNIRGLVRALFKGEVKHFELVTRDGWTNTGVNSGNEVATGIMHKQLRAAAVANSSILSTMPIYFLNDGGTDPTYINWAKKLLFVISHRRVHSDAEAVHFLQIKQSSAIGQIAAPGIEIKASNLGLEGYGYGTSLSTAVDFTTDLAEGKSVLLSMFLDATGLEFFLNNVSQGKITTAGKFPIAEGSAAAYVAFSNANGATGSLSDIQMGGIHIIQEV